MIKNPDVVAASERELFINEKISHKKALKIFELLRREAISLGAMRDDNILDGEEADIEIARTINGLPK